MTPEQRIDRANNAKRALAEFLDPAFEVVAAEYSDRLTAICASKPWATNEIAALANATRIVREVRSQIAQLVADGEDARAGKSRSERIAQMTPAKRRLLQIGAL